MWFRKSRLIATAYRPEPTSELMPMIDANATSAMRESFISVSPMRGRIMRPVIELSGIARTLFVMFVTQKGSAKLKLNLNSPSN
jgi:hypothetical protein